MSIRERAAAILAETPWLRREALAERVRVIQFDRTRGRQARYARLVQLAAEAMGAIAPHTPCRRGCSHCCHQPVSILQREANAIAKLTGRTPRPIKPFAGPAEVQRRKIETAARYTGVACTFLGPEGECTIYEVRPLTCRTHHTIADNAEPCGILRQGGEGVPSIDLLPIKWAAAQDSMGEPFADIREFFPAAI